MRFLLLLLAVTATTYAKRPSRDLGYNYQPPGQPVNLPKVEVNRPSQPYPGLLAPQGLPSGLPQGLLQFPQGFPQGLPQGLPQGFPQGFLQGLPQGLPNLPQPQNIQLPQQGFQPSLVQYQTQYQQNLAVPQPGNLVHIQGTTLVRKQENLVPLSPVVPLPQNLVQIQQSPVQLTQSPVQLQQYQPPQLVPQNLQQVQLPQELPLLPQNLPQVPLVPEVQQGQGPLNVPVAPRFEETGISSLSNLPNIHLLASNGGTGTLVTKNVYFHVAPEDHEVPSPPRYLAPQPPAPVKKHYKIIFIKAPSAPAPKVPVIPLQPQSEEKTIVYVLVRKPEEQPEIVVPTPQPTEPSKPEVYFIRYKSPEHPPISLPPQDNLQVVQNIEAPLVPVVEDVFKKETVLPLQENVQNFQNVQNNVQFTPLLNSGELVSSGESIDTSFNRPNNNLSTSYGPPKVQEGPYKKKK